MPRSLADARVMTLGRSMVVVPPRWATLTVTAAAAFSRSAASVMRAADCTATLLRPPDAHAARAAQLDQGAAVGRADRADPDPAPLDEQRPHQAEDRGRAGEQGQLVARLVGDRETGPGLDAVEGQRRAARQLHRVADGEQTRNGL